MNVTIRSIRVIPGETGCALEIISDHPLVPQIGKLENPARIVIDLPNAHLSSGRKRLAFRSSEVVAVRLGQFQDSVARIVVDLAQPLDYSWDAAGNRLVVRMHPGEASPKASSVPSLIPQAPPAFVPIAAPEEGHAALASNLLPGGSSITAGADAAVLSLGRGGEIRVCPGTTVSITPSENGRSLMLGMSTGSLEAHYRLDASSDSILTPDFRMLLAGPGEFHYAVSADPRGNTCVQALPGNTAYVIVSEVLGDGNYQVKPAEQVMFHSGQLRTAAAALMGIGCGCPAPTPAIMRAALPPAELENGSQQSALEIDQSSKSHSAAMNGPLVPGPETAALPATKPEDVHVQVDVPFVYRANEPDNELRQYKSATVKQAEELPLRQMPHTAWLSMSALPPSRVSSRHHGFLGRVKGIFSAIFG